MADCSHTGLCRSESLCGEPPFTLWRQEAPAGNVPSIPVVHYSNKENAEFCREHKLNEKKKKQRQKIQAGKKGNFFSPSVVGNYHVIKEIRGQMIKRQWGQNCCQLELKKNEEESRLSQKYQMSENSEI